MVSGCSPPRRRERRRLGAFERRLSGRVGRPVSPATRFRPSPGCSPTVAVWGRRLAPPDLTARWDRGHDAARLGGMSPGRPTHQAHRAGARRTRRNSHPPQRRDAVRAEPSALRRLGGGSAFGLTDLGVEGVGIGLERRAHEGRGARQADVQFRLRADLNDALGEHEVERVAAIVAVVVDEVQVIPATDTPCSKAGVKNPASTPLTKSDSMTACSLAASTIVFASSPSRSSPISDASASKVAAMSPRSSSVGW